MKGALVILAAMVVIGIALYLIDVFYYRKRLPADSGIPEESPSTREQRAEKQDADEEECCGMHQVCEKTNLSPHSAEIIYYDDEELDRFRGREADNYSMEEIEEFRDVLMTLLPQDVAGWSRSLQVREITPPIEIRDELLLIVADLRHS